MSQLAVFIFQLAVNFLSWEGRVSKICMLLGAGASIEYGVPSTVSLTNQIENKILTDGWLLKNKADETYKLIRSTLNTFLVKPGGEHFEQIYHVIDELSQATYVVGPDAYDEFRYLLQPFIEIKDNGILSHDKLSMLQQRYIQCVYEIISEACNFPKCSITPFRNFLNNLTSSHTVRIYSLNYDDYVLQAKPDLFNGFEKKDSGKFNKNDFFRNNSISSVFQLHGSIRMGYPSLGNSNHFGMGELGWFEKRDEALKHIEATSSGDRQMNGGEVKLSPIITGLNKMARIQSAPFNYYYSSLAVDLFASEYVIVAGYGMGDIHVNKWLTEARLANPDLKIIFIDFWNGPIILDLSRRIIEIIHTLRVDLAAGMYKNGPSKGWVLFQNSKAAIWTDGFQAFLNDTNLSKVLKSI